MPPLSIKRATLALWHFLRRRHDPASTSMRPAHTSRPPSRPCIECTTVRLTATETRAAVLLFHTHRQYDFDHAAHAVLAQGDFANDSMSLSVLLQRRQSAQAVVQRLAQPGREFRAFLLSTVSRREPGATSWWRQPGARMAPRVAPPLQAFACNTHLRRRVGCFVGYGEQAADLAEKRWRLRECDGAISRHAERLVIAGMDASGRCALMWSLSAEARAALGLCTCTHRGGSDLRPHLRTVSRKPPPRARAR